MKSIELKDLVAALLTIIAIALACGKLGQLHDFAKSEAQKSLKGWKAHPFFPPHYEVQVPNHRPN